MPPVSYLSGVWYRLCQRFFMDDQIESADLYKKHQIMLKHSISPRRQCIMKHAWMNMIFQLDKKR